MPTEDLGSISTTLPQEFNIDQAFLRVFGQHPLFNAIAWDYMLNGIRSEFVIKEAFYGPSDQGLVEYAQARKRRPIAVGPQFWMLYAQWMAPSYQHIAQWRMDILTHIETINEEYDRKDEPIFTKHDLIVEEMKKEFPQRVEAFNAAFESGGLKAAIDIYIGYLKMGRWVTDTTYIMDPARLNRDRYFNVINFCVRLLTDFLTARRQEGPERGAEQSEEIVQLAMEQQKILTEPLVFWPLIAHKLNWTEKNMNLNTFGFWQDERVQTLITYALSVEPVREAVQRIFLYGDVNPHIGLDPAINEINKQIFGQRWTNEYQHIGLLHTTQKPMVSNPWRHKGSDFQNADFNRENFEVLKILMMRVPKISEMPGYQKRVQPQDATPGTIVLMADSDSEDWSPPPVVDKGKGNSLLQVGIVAAAGVALIYYVA